MNIAPEPLGSVDMALAHAKRLLEKNPDLAAEQAREILNADPAHPAARLILGAAQRRERTRSPGARCARTARSRAAARRAACIWSSGSHAPRPVICRRPSPRFAEPCSFSPRSADGMAVAGRLSGGRRRPGRRRRCEGAICFGGGARPSPEGSGGGVDAQRFAAGGPPLARSPGRLSDRRGGAAHARRGGGAIAQLCGGSRTARAVPGSRSEFRCRTPELCRGAQPPGKAGAALPHAERLLAKDAGNPGHLNLKAAILANLGDYQGSIDLYSPVLRDHPRQPKVWMSFAHALKTARPVRGQRDRLSARDRRWSRRSARLTGAWPT